MNENNLYLKLEKKKIRLKKQLNEMEKEFYNKKCKVKLLIEEVEMEQL